jgi:hypothetical protein
LSCNKNNYHDIDILEEFNNISVIEFSSDDIYYKLIKKENIKLFREILYIAIMVNTNNIINHNTTRTSNNSAYNFQYIYIDSNLDYNILEKRLIKHIYDPLHPDTIRNGEMQGYVEYPDIDIFEENKSISGILNILFLINN